MQDIMDIMQIQIEMLSRGQPNLGVKPSLYHRLAARCGKTLREATWEDLTRFCGLAAELLCAARVFSGQSRGKAPTMQQYQWAQRRGDAIM